LTALLAAVGFIGGTAVVISAAFELGLDPGDIGFQLMVLAAAYLCLLQFAVASHALCRRRLNARGESHLLVDAVLGLAVLALTLSLNDAAQSAAASLWPLPQTPPRIAALVAAACALGLVALVLECGVFVRLSLVELWRKRGASPEKMPLAQ